MILKARLEKENLEKSFSRAESKLNKVLVERQAEVQLGCKQSKNLKFLEIRVLTNAFLKIAWVSRNDFHPKYSHYTATW